MLVDAYLLVYATDAQSPHHDIAHAWLDGVLNGTERVGLAREVLGAFMRLMANPRVALSPMSPTDAWRVVESWLSSEVAWIPAPSHRSVAILGELVVRHHIGAKVIPDAQLRAGDRARPDDRLGRFGLRPVPRGALDQPSARRARLTCATSS